MSVDENAWHAWRQSRHDDLAGADSWLGLAGLFWLDAEHGGRNSVGSAADATVVLPDGPPRLGEIVIADDGALRWESAGGYPLLLDEQASGVKSGVAGQFLQVALRSDDDGGGAPSVLGLGALRFFVIKRDGRFAVRVKNRHWAATQPFLGLGYFPYAAEWIVDADWQALAVSQLIEVPSVSGDLKRVEITHRAVFQHEGMVAELLPLTIDATGVFFVFRDRTSGKTSYGGGRFLRAALPVQGKLKLDFNRAYNPPCAFSPFATCPLPPPENWLGFAVEAGEKRYAGH